jgi:hypothetical protein
LREVTNSNSRSPIISPVLESGTPSLHCPRNPSWPGDKTALFAWASKPEPCPESGDSPGIPVRQQMTSPEKGGIVQRLYDARVVDMGPLVHESHIISLVPYRSLLVEVSPCLSSWPKMEPVFEKIEFVSVDDDPKRELSEGTCQDGNVESGLGTVFAGSVFVAGLGFFPSLTYTTTILYDSWQLLHRPAWTTLLSLRV